MGNSMDTLAIQGTPETELPFALNIGNITLDLNHCTDFLYISKKVKTNRLLVSSIQDVLGAWLVSRERQFDPPVG